MLDEQEAGDEEKRPPTHSPSYLDFIAFSGACGKSWVVSYNRQPRPETSGNLQKPPETVGHGRSDMAPLSARAEYCEPHGADALRVRAWGRTEVG